MPAASDPTTQTRSPRAVFGLRVLVFTVGMASLGAEIAAARLMAPWFGASTIVWANTIGVVLVALSAGYALGGRWADRRPDEASLRRVMLGASLLLAAVPLVAGPLLPLSAEAFDRLDAGAFLGSLAAVSALVGLPVILLGMASPWATRISNRRVEETGRTAGNLFALSTVGSLLGTFLASLLLVPFVGTQRTFLLFAAVLAIVAASGLRVRDRLLALLPAVLLALPPGATKPGEDVAVIHERETPYQYVRVIQRPGGSRALELNEGQAAHSVWRPGTVLTGGVWDGYLVAPLAVLGRAPRSLAMLGNAAGTVARAYREFFPQTTIDGVEIDAALTEVGRRYFDMRNPRLTVHHADARPFLRSAERRWEAIAIDAYRQPYIPFYLTTKEFFALVRKRLEPEGVVIVNVGHPEGQLDLERVLAAGLRTAFSTVLRYPKEDENTLLVASNAGGSAQRLRTALSSLPPALQPVAFEASSLIEPADADDRAYTDDRAPVEWLIDASIVRYATEGD